MSYLRPNETELIDLTREDLYALIWSKPITQLAPDFMITGAALAKRCRSLNVPLPGRGYWAKVEAGHKPVRAKLPAARKGEPTSVRVRRRVKPEDAPAIAPPVFGTVPVPDTLDGAHPLVQAAWTTLSVATTRESGFLDHPLDSEHASVYVTRATLQRALRLLEALARAGEAVGWTLAYERPAGVRPGGTRIVVAGVMMPIVIEEQRSLDPTRTHLLPNGLLRIEVARGSELVSGLRRAWNDRRVLKLEDQLGQVCEGIWRCAQEIGAWQARRRVWDAEAEERARIAVLAWERKEREARWTKDLDERLSVLARGKAIRELLALLPGEVRASEWGAWLEGQAGEREGRIVVPPIESVTD